MDKRVETNIRLFPKRRDLFVWVRKARLSGPNLSEENAEKVCVKLAGKHNLAAIVNPHSSSSELLVVSRYDGYAVPEMNLEISELSFTLVDSGEETRRISLASPEGDHILPLLLERALSIKLMHTEYWTYDSTRLWYEPEAFKSVDGIDAYRRYKIGAIPLEEEGVGIAVDVQRAFFSTYTLAWYFDRSVEIQEQTLRREIFERLSLRQKDQKGTLLYSLGDMRLKCYFVEAPGRTCKETGSFSVRGRKYQNLVDYYHTNHQNVNFDPDGEAILVSFKGLDGKPKWVSAELLRVRITNDSLPKKLKSLEIAPADRRYLISGFWAKLGDRPFGGVVPDPDLDFWKPDKGKILDLPLPKLCFGESASLSVSEGESGKVYGDYFEKRIEYLDECGCWRVANDMPRTLYFAYPTTVELKMVEGFASAMTQRIRSWTKKDIKFVPPVMYESIHDCKQKLQQYVDAGMLILILDDESSNYYESAYQLDRWRIKRLTPHSLKRHYDALQNGWYNNKSHQYDKNKGRNRWNDFVVFNGLAVLQLLDAYPYVYAGTQGYEAQLFIDVGYSRQDFVITLLIARDEDKQPAFDIASRTIPKPDTKHESINKRILTDSIEQLLVERLWRRFDPLTSLLVQRDGRFCGEEEQAVLEAVGRLKQSNRILEDAEVSLVDLRKTSENPVRLWEIDSFGNVNNPLEGTALHLNAKTLVIASTGQATLRQGTANPFMLVSNGHCNDINRAGQAVFAATQLNWSSPQVAQRLPIHVKNSDELLQDRAAQMIRGLN